MSAKRSRDQFGRFSSGASGTALAQFGNEDMRFKKPKGASSVFPTPGNVGRLNVGNEPPNAASLATGYSSGVIDLGSNSTSSVPVQARKWSPINNVAEMSPSAIVFVRRDGNMNKHKSVADLPTMQWLLRKDRDLLTAGSASDLSAGSFEGDGGVLSRKGGWNLLGILRNTYTQGSAMITLCNVDVFGRSKVPCIFGDRLCTGQRVGLALIPVDLRNVPYCTMGPGSGARDLDNYLKSLTNDAVAEMKCQTAEEYMSKSSGRYMTYRRATSTHVWQWLPTVNGKLCKHVWDMVERGATEEPQKDFIHHVSLGCISNAHMAGRAPELHQKMALFDSNKMTTLPTIEILME